MRTFYTPLGTISRRIHGNTLTGVKANQHIIFHTHAKGEQCPVDLWIERDGRAENLPREFCWEFLPYKGV